MNIIDAIRTCRKEKNMTLEQAKEFVLAHFRKMGSEGEGGKSDGE